VSGPVTAVPDAVGASKVLQSPTRVTEADGDAMVLLPVGGTFLLALGGPPPDWSVRVGNPQVLARQVNVMVVRGAQGIYRARSVGVTWLEATASYPCERTAPRCLMPTRVFRVVVVVTPAESVVQGTVERLEEDAVLLRTPPIRAACPQGAVCPMWIRQGEQLTVRLADATFEDASGREIPRPSLRVGDKLVAAGTFADGALAAQAVSLVP
jgi:hypothetical protein